MVDKASGNCGWADNSKRVWSWRNNFGQFVPQARKIKFLVIMMQIKHSRRAGFFVTACGQQKAPGTTPGPQRNGGRLKRIAQ
jgi:hypothetical protein